MKAHMIGIVISIFAATVLQAAEIRVRDAKALADAAARVQPGDVVMLAGGVWADADLRFRAQGTMERPVTLRAEAPGETVLSGRSRLRISGRHIVVEGLLFKVGAGASADVIELRTHSREHAEHCRITQCAIVQEGGAAVPGAPDRAADPKWVSIYGRSNRVDHCYFAGKTSGGTMMVVWLDGQPNHHRIDHNHFGFRTRLGRNGGETLRIGDSNTSMSDSLTIVERNLFTGCGGEAEIISNKSCGNVYRGNTFIGCPGALTLRHGNRCRVEGNFFFGAGVKETGGVRVIGEDHTIVNNYFHGLLGEDARAALCVMNGVPDSPLNLYYQVRRAVVAFNTFVNCRSTIELGLAGDKKATLPPVDCTIANNLLMVDAGGSALRVHAQPKNMTWAGNIAWGPGAGTSPGFGLITADPKLRDSPDGLYRPGEGSAVIGAAVALPIAIAADIDGQPRGPRPDVGCDQVSQEKLTNWPLKAVDVGPDWLEPSLRR